MTPYYDQDGITIYHADYREVMPVLTFGVIITDPPYGTSYYSSDTDEMTSSVLVSLNEKAQTVAIFGWPERLIRLCVEAQVVPSEWVTWWPTNAALRGPHTHSLRSEVECIAVFGTHELATVRVERPPSAWLNPNWFDSAQNRGRDRKPATIDRAMMRASDVWRDPSPGLGVHHKKRLHPNEKPLSLMTKLVTGLAQLGDVICDPFMGSGTTLRAAKDLGQKAIGIEIEERYCEIAVQRLAQQVLAL